MSNTHSYIFGRLNLITGQPYENKTEFILLGLRSSNSLKKSNMNWCFVKVKRLDSEEGNFIYGVLVKYKESSPEEVINEEAGTIEEEIVENFIEAKSLFFLHIDSGIIAYRPVSKISRNQFITNFCELFKQAYNNFFVDAEIESIEEEYEFFQKLQEFEVINRIEIQLHPSNPSLRDDWKDIDNKLKALKASTYKEEYEAKNETSGLNIKAIQNDPDIKSKLTMADDGYGKAKVVGKIKEELKQITTSDHPVTMDVPIHENIQDTFNELKSGFFKIFNRFKKVKK